MPAAIPVAASVFGAISGAGTFAAAGGLAALAAGSAGALLAGATVVGSVLTGVGALTGNARLTKVGAAIGLVGGIGTALSKATAPGALAETAKATAGNTVSDAIAAQSPAAQALAEGAKRAAPGLLEQAAGPPLAGALEQANPFLAGGESLAAPALTAPALTADTGGLIFGQSPLTATPAAVPPPSSGLGLIGSAVRSVTDFIQANPEAAKLYGGVLQGAMKPYLDKQAMQQKLNADKKWADWVSQRYSDSVRNLVIPSPIPPAPGIIAGQRG